MLNDRTGSDGRNPSVTLDREIQWQVLAGPVFTNMDSPHQICLENIIVIFRKRVYDGQSLGVSRDNPRNILDGTSVHYRAPCTQTHPYTHSFTPRAI